MKFVNIKRMKYDGQTSTWSCDLDR